MMRRLGPLFAARYRIEFVEPGSIFDAVHVLLVSAKNWAEAMAIAKRLVQLRGTGDRILAVRRIH